MAFDGRLARNHVTVPSEKAVTDSKGLSEGRDEIQLVQNQQDSDLPKKTRGRRRQHASPAERQRAYRERRAAGIAVPA